MPNSSPSRHALTSYTSPGCRGPTDCHRNVTVPVCELPSCGSISTGRAYTIVGEDAGHGEAIAELGRTSVVGVRLGVGEGGQVAVPVAVGVDVGTLVAVEDGRGVSDVETLIVIVGVGLGEGVGVNVAVGVMVWICDA